MVMAMMTAASSHPAAIHRPPKTIQSMFSNIETGGMGFFKVRVTRARAGRRCRSYDFNRNYQTELPRGSGSTGVEKHAVAAVGRSIRIEAERVVINRGSTTARNICSCEAARALDRRAERRSSQGDAALHRAMNPGLQKGNLGLAIERPERRFQQPSAKARFPDLADRRTFGLVPGNVEAIVRHRP